MAEQKAAADAAAAKTTAATAAKAAVDETQDSLDKAAAERKAFAEAYEQK